MKLKITKPGYHDLQGKPVEVGTIITVDGDKVPTALLNKCEVIAGDTAGKEPVTNPASAPVDFDRLTVDELKAHLTDKGVQFPDDAKKADLVALAKK